MNIAKLQYITREDRYYSHVALAQAALEGGVKWVQLRVKNRHASYWREEALLTQEMCNRHGAIFIINDNVYLAKEILADGVHLGRNDMPVKEARKILGDQFVIGGTANTFEDIQRLADDRVDYIGLGPFRFTRTKKGLSPILGLEGYQELISKTRLAGIQIPIIAIGGIALTDISPLMETGIHGIAVSSAISNSPNIPFAARQFVQAVKQTDTVLSH